jgi:hypothetical protein
VALVRRQSGSVEEGLRIIDANLPCENLGGIDLVGVSTSGQLTLIEVDSHANDGLLLRGMGHLDWIVRNMQIVRRMYPGQPINYESQPRLLFIAPGFSPTFQSAARQYSGSQIHYLKCHSVSLLGGLGVLFERNGF